MSSILRLRYVRLRMEIYGIANTEFTGCVQFTFWGSGAFYDSFRITLTQNNHLKINDKLSFAKSDRTDYHQQQQQQQQQQ